MEGGGISHVCDQQAVDGAAAAGRRRRWGRPALHHRSRAQPCLCHRLIVNLTAIGQWMPQPRSSWAPTAPSPIDLDRPGWGS
jgi:hypothetical protein